MNKEEILAKYKKQEEKLLIAKLLDKILLTEKRNKITYTNFLDEYQKRILEKVLKELNVKNSIILGGYETAERNIIVLYPNKLELIPRENIVKDILNVIRIELPKESYEKYTHRDYLGALMKIGIQREKIGDIIVEENGADIIVIKEIAQYVKETISNLKRFSKSNVEFIDIKDLRKNNIKKQEKKLIVASLRLDNIVSELAKISRKKAEEIIAEEKVFLNFELQSKNTKQVKEGDKITIRGKGRFEIKEINGTTKNGRIIFTVEKYI